MLRSIPDQVSHWGPPEGFVSPTPPLLRAVGASFSAASIVAQGERGRRAGFPACRFTGLSSPVLVNGLALKAVEGYFIIRAATCASARSGQPTP